jgi:hypothetical protein
LQQWPVGGQREEGKADRNTEQAEQEQLLAVGRRQAPALGNGNREKNGSAQHHREVDEQSERTAYKAGQNIGIGVTEQQNALKEYHGHRPYRWRAAKPRQHHLREHGLHGEQQRRAEEDRRGIDRND